MPEDIRSQEGVSVDGDKIIDPLITIVPRKLLYSLILILDGLVREAGFRKFRIHMELQFVSELDWQGSPCEK